MLTIKDAIATILTGFTALFAYLTVDGFRFPMVTNYRIASLVLLIVGIGMCASFSNTQNTTNQTMMTLAGILGGAALILVIAGLITANKIVFILLAADIIVLWAITTLRHAIAK